MSRTLLTQRLRQLERIGVVERTGDARYRLTESGLDLEPVVWGMGDWAARWLFGDPGKEHVDARHLMWRVRQRIVDDALPATRTVVQFDFSGGPRDQRIWLLLDPGRSAVCERDEGFDVDLWVRGDIGEFMRVWAGRSTWARAFGDGALSLHGPSTLVRGFPGWFALSPFAGKARPGAAGR